MALLDVIKHFGTSFSGEIKEARSILGRVRLNGGTNALGANFRKFGASFDVYEYEDYIERAKDFFRVAQASPDPLYTIVEFNNNRVGIDYNGEIRGIFTGKGRPLAFFRPNYRQLGYASKQEEIKAFRIGKVSV